MQSQKYFWEGRKKESFSGYVRCSGDRPTSFRFKSSYNRFIKGQRKGEGNKTRDIKNGCDPISYVPDT